MKKNTVANIIMVAIIAVIVICGVLLVAFIQGRFDRDDGKAAVLCDVQGTVNILRDGISFPVTDNTVLRVDDTISTLHGGKATIRLDDGHIFLSENTELSVISPTPAAFKAEVESGEIIADCAYSSKLDFNGESISVIDSAAYISVRSGAATVGVLRGKIGDASSGKAIEYVDNSVSVSDFSAESLNDFAMSTIRSLLNTKELCFSAADLDKVTADRQQAMQDLINNNVNPSPDDTQTKNKCTIAIYCSTILDNLSELESGKLEFVPDDGVILAPVSVHFDDGDTVFDVLKQVCDAANIQIEYSWTPLYDSYYVEGINNLYEFDCGFESGWMYQVNGWFPNYGCSSYHLKDGDVIVWQFTCKGLGADVGAPRFE